MNIIPSGNILGARVEGLDLSQVLSDEQFKTLEAALGRHGVLSYPEQALSSQQLRDFAARFGTLEINVAGAQIARRAASEQNELLSRIQKFFGLN